MTTSILVRIAFKKQIFNITIGNFFQFLERIRTRFAVFSSRLKPGTIPSLNLPKTMLTKVVSSPVRKKNEQRLERMMSRHLP